MQKTILVVEDERSLADAIKEKLENSDFSVLAARTVDQALEYCEGVKKIDAIWLDHYLLGKKDGLDFVATLKKSTGALHEIPIFVVSNTAGPDKLLSYIHLGVQKYYIKAENKLADIISDIRTSLEEVKTV